TKQMGRWGNAEPRRAAELHARRSKSYAITQDTRRSSRILRAVCQSSLRKKRALSSIPGKLSWELPATAGCLDQYPIEGESHHGARNARVSADWRVTARSRNCTDSFRRSMRRAYSASLGQTRASQSRKIGKSDNTNTIAIHTPNQIQPPSRYFAKILFRSRTRPTASTMKNKTSGSYAETQTASAQAIPLMALHREVSSDRKLHSAQIAIVNRSINND